MEFVFFCKIPSKVAEHEKTTAEPVVLQQLLMLLNDFVCCPYEGTAFGGFLK